MKWWDIFSVRVVRLVAPNVKSLYAFSARKLGKKISKKNLWLKKPIDSFISRSSGINYENFVTGLKFFTISHKIKAVVLHGVTPKSPVHSVQRVLQPLIWRYFERTVN